MLSRYDEIRADVLYWVGLLISAFSLVALLSSLWGVYLNLYVYEAECPRLPCPVPEPMARIGWAIPAVFGALVFLAVGLHMNRQGARRKT